MSSTAHDNKYRSQYLYQKHKLPVPPTVSYSRLWRPAREIIGHFGDNLPNQSFDSCKNSSLPNEIALLV